MANENVRTVIEAAHLGTLLHAGHTDELVRSVIGGDRSAVGKIVEGHRELAILIALDLRPPGWREEDAIQEAWLALERIAADPIEDFATQLVSAVRDALSRPPVAPLDGVEVTFPFSGERVVLHPSGATELNPEAAPTTDPPPA